MRKRRLARLAGLNTNNTTAGSSTTTTSSSPSTPGPSKVFTGSMISPSIQQQRVDIPMEVEESSDKQCNSSGIDVDSGIENMEVDESDRKDSIPRSRVSFYIEKRRKICA